MQYEFKAFVIMNEARGIGQNGQIPWQVPEAQSLLSQLLPETTWVTGRNGYAAIEQYYGPLPIGRRNIISASSDASSYPAGVGVWDSLDQFLQGLRVVRNAPPQSGQVWFLGGAKLFESSLSKWGEVYVTVVHEAHDSDAYLPAFEHEFELGDEQHRRDYTLYRYVRRPARGIADPG